jgi:hypothetical protein
MLKLYISGIKADFELSLEDFELFWYSKPIKTLREYKLLYLSFSINYI